MSDDLNTRISLLARRELEARILAPLLDRLVEDYGEDKMLDLLRDTIMTIACQQGSELAVRLGGNSLGDFAQSVSLWTHDDALALELLEQTDDTFAFNVTRCRYAEMYEALGMRLLGRTLSCARDSWFLHGFNPDLELHRTQTIMEGAPVCDFVYRLRKAGTQIGPRQGACMPTRDVVEYYNQYDEAGRLLSGVSRLELARTQELILRHLPSRPPLRIVDIGGAAGIYSFWLAEQGHEVHLYDLTPKHIELASERNAAAPSPLASTRVGDARQLPFASDWADVVLLFGPLYHLPECEDRRLAIAEARRVLKPGGILFAAAISRFASLLDGYARGYVRDPAFVTIVQQDLATGVHRNPTGRAEYFTTAYFHRPEELASELTEAGLASAGVYAVEGFAAAIPGFDSVWDDPASRDLLLQMIHQTECESALIGMSWHLLAVGTKA